ncbi:MAG: hypothetical protein FWC62_09005 [Firmicutes bacterium]|nr:hypothetical protein [Bacillota bacterium]
MMEEREFNNIYAIPANYTDSGKLLGGMLETRNTIEAGILLLLAGYPELMWLSIPVTAKVIVMTVTLLPLAVAALMGISGDSLFQFIAHLVKFFVRRRKLHLRRVGYKYAKDKTKAPKWRSKRK